MSTDRFDLVVIGGGNAGFVTAAQLLAYTKSVTLLDYAGQFKADPGIMAGTSRPDYARCVDITTQAALREMVDG